MYIDILRCTHTYIHTEGQGETEKERSIYLYIEIHTFMCNDAMILEHMLYTKR